MKVVAGILLALLLPVPGFAAGPPVAASMLVRGTITVNPDGSVAGYVLDQQAQLPAAVVTLIRRTVPTWKFDPVVVDGQDVPAKALMSLRIVADRDADGQFLARVTGAQFGDDAAAGRGKCAPGACVAYMHRTPPRYPLPPLREGASGTVYLVQEIGRDGRVINQAVRQVNLRTEGSAAQLKAWRQQFADASLEAGKGWSYHVPTTGTEAGKDHWTVTIPINFTLVRLGGQHRLDQPGHWDLYIPGPVQPIPWPHEHKGLLAGGGNADAVPDNGRPFMADPRFVLLTPLASPGPTDAGASIAPTGG